MAPLKNENRCVCQDAEPIARAGLSDNCVVHAILSDRPAAAASAPPPRRGRRAAPRLDESDEELGGIPPEVLEAAAEQQRLWDASHDSLGGIAVESGGPSSTDGPDLMWGFVQAPPPP